MSRAATIILTLACAVSTFAATLSPQLVKELSPGTIAAKSTLDSAGGQAVGNVVFFRTYGEEGGVWRTDGTPHGTFRIYDGRLDRFPGMPGGLTSALERSFFTIHTLDRDTLLYTTDGTTPGTRYLTNIDGWSGGAECGEGKVCFAGLTTDINVTDGTAAGTKFLLYTSLADAEPFARQMQPVGKRVFFNSYEDLTGRCMSIDSVFRYICGELWVSDGTTTGTHLFKDLNPGPYPSGPYDFFASSSGKLFFRALTPGSQSSLSFCQVWVSDGTPDGTKPLTPDASRFSCNPISPPFVEAGGSVYYIGAFATIWRSDGTTEGTKIVRPEQPVYANTATKLVTLSDRLLVYTLSGLLAWDGESFTEIATGNLTDLGYLASHGRRYFTSGGYVWSTDGTRAGTRQHFLHGASGGTVAPFAETPRALYFTAGASNLYVTDGTVAGTRQITFNTTTGNGAGPGRLIEHDGKLFFTAGNPFRYGYTDGTADGTVIFAEAPPTNSPMFVANGQLHIRDTSSRLWVTDGTSQGTRLLSAMLNVPYIAETPVTLGSTMVYVGGSPSEKMLMRRDATGATAELPAKGIVSGLTTAGASALAWRWDNTGAEIVATDGTIGGTRVITPKLHWTSQIAAFRDGAIFGARTADREPVSLWISDLTRDGTKPLKVVTTDGRDELLPLTTWKDLAIFAVGDEVGLRSIGETIWRTDGTPDGTFPLSPNDFLHAVADGDRLKLLRAKATAVMEWEVWSSDGTAAGTKKLFGGEGTIISAPFRLPGGSLAFLHTSAPGRLQVRNTDDNTAIDIAIDDLAVYPAVYFEESLYFSGCRGSLGCELFRVALDGSTVAEPADVGVEYVGPVRTATGRGAAFRISITSRGSLHPEVVASTADGTLVAGRDYVPFSIPVVFEKDQPVTVVVPFTSADANGSVSVVLSNLKNATTTRGIATAWVSGSRTRPFR